MVLSQDKQVLEFKESKKKPSLHDVQNDVVVHSLQVLLQGISQEILVVLQVAHFVWSHCKQDPELK